MSNTNVRFKISKVDVEEEGGRLVAKQTIEALRQNDSVITTFVLECGLDEVDNLARIKTQSIKKLAEYEAEQRNLRAVEEWKRKAHALEGKVIGEIASPSEERWV